MKRKFLSILSVILLLCQFPCCVLAAEENAAKIRSGYWTDDVLYTFVSFPQEEPEKLEVSLFVNNHQQGRGAKPELFSSTGATVHYMLLVDTSSSMSELAYLLSAFAKSLLEYGSNLDISIAATGSDFHVVGTDLTSWDDVHSALRRLNYLGGSDICGGTAKALEYLGGKNYRAGDVCSLVVITDGEPWYSNTPSVELEREEQAAKAAAAMIDAYPEIIVNTLCFRNWEENAFAVLSTGRGLHLSANAVSDVSNLGKALSDYMGSLYTVVFPLKGYEGIATINDSVQLFAENSWLSLGRIRNLNMQPAMDAGDEIVLPPVDGSEESPAQGTESTEPAIEAAMPAEAETDSAVKDHASPLMVGTVAAIAAVVVVALAIVGILAKKKKAEEFSIRMRAEILCGKAVKKKEIYHLTNELLIGTGKQCDIVIQDPDAAPVNTRIFKQGQMIYIEDMGSPKGTVLNGMRIFSSNRLRSEDEISIGSTVFRFLF